MTIQERCALAKLYLSCYPGLVSGNKNPPHLSYIADRIQEALEKKSDKYQLLLISCPPRHGKPIDVKSKVLMGDGTLKPLNDIKIGDYVYTHTGQIKKVLEVHNQGLLDCIQFKTASGRLLISAPDHPLLTPEGWVEAKYIETGMCLSNRATYQEINNNRSIYEARLAGYFIGDGCCTKITTTINAKITCNDDIEALDIKKCINQLNFSEGKSDKDSITIKNGVRKWLYDIGLAEHNSHNKRVPIFIFNGNNELIANFLGAYFSCDGSINQREKSRKDACAEFYSVNKRLLQDIQHLLLRLGIQSTLRIKNGRYKNKKHISWRLSITSQDDIAKFNNIVPIYSHKRNILNQWAYHRQNFDQDIITDKVISVKHGFKRHCKCLLVEDDHSFIANDIIVHNTELISKHLPSWILGKYPKKRIILTSYSAELSDNNSDVAKNIFERWGDVLFGVKPSKSMFKRSAWDTHLGGGVISAGTGGSITGFGADVFIIDDYVKGAEDAESSGAREKLWQWWQAVAGSRLHPECVVIVMATRWHDDDLIGRLRKQQKEQGEDFPFEITDISLPAIALENDLLGRKEGEALWPARYNVKKLGFAKNISGSYWWNALFMCSPVDRGGTLFKREFFRYYEKDYNTGDYLCFLPGHENPIRVDKRSLIKRLYVDPALEKKLKNDPSGALAWAYDRRHKIWLLLDRLNDRIEHTQVLSTLLSFAFKNNCTSIGMENEKIGKILVKQSAGKDRVGGVPIPLKEVKCGRLDKYARATPMASYMENERVFFPKNAPWLAEFEDNIVKFPNRTDHDEDVDCIAYAQDLEDSISVAEALSGRK